MARDDMQDVEQLMQGVRAGRLSRRDFIKRAAALGFSASAVATFLAACGASPTATALAPTARAAGTTAATAASGAAPTVAAAATQVAPTVAAAATQVAGGAASPTRPGSPGASPAAGGAAGTIKFYSSFPMNSASKAQIDTIVNAYKMALEDVNYKVGNLTIVYDSTTILDDGSPGKNGAWDGAVEAANANKATADASAMVYLGTFNSGAAKVAIPINNRANLVQISPANTYPGLTKKLQAGIEQNEPDAYYPTGKRNYCRTIPTDDLQGGVGATFAQELGAKKVYVIDDTELYGHGVAVFFAEAAKKLGMDVIGPEGTDPKAADYRSLAQKIKSSGADMVYYGGTTDNNPGKIWKDLRQVLGADLKMMGPDGIFEQGWLDQAGDAAEGSYITFGGVPPDQLKGKGADFVKKYKDKYKGDPAAYTAYAYESMLVVLDALKRAGRKDREAIRAALFATKDWDGVLGKWSFTETGDTTLTAMSVNQVKNGKFVFVKVVESKA